MLNYFKRNKQNLSNNYNLLNKAKIIIITLPTPLKKYIPDMQYVENCIKNLKNYNLFNKVIILESTVYPGATDECFKEYYQNKI